MTLDIPLPIIKPIYTPTPIPCPSNPSTESSSTQNLISILNLSPHPEGGYFLETDRNPLQIANPYHNNSRNVNSINKHNDSTHGVNTDIKSSPPQKSDDNNADKTRAASTSIFYLITPRSPRGAFHRNRSRTVRTLHRGRGRYVVIHADRAAREGGKASIESFVVGQRIDRGKRLQWVVEGGDYKASYLLPDDDGEEGESSGLLITENVVPGFELADHDFLTPQDMEKLLLRTRFGSWTGCLEITSHDAFYTCRGFLVNACSALLHRPSKSR